MRYKITFKDTYRAGSEIELQFDKIYQFGFILNVWKGKVFDYLGPQLMKELA